MAGKCKIKGKWIIEKNLERQGAIQSTTHLINDFLKVEKKIWRKSYDRTWKDSKWWCHLSIQKSRSDVELKCSRWHRSVIRPDTIEIYTQCF